MAIPTDFEAAKPARATPRTREFNPLRFLLAPIASLKLTLVLLGMAIFLIFAGTLAQAQAGMWEAISHYFSSWTAWVQLQVFLPKPWFPGPHEYLGAEHTYIKTIPGLGECRFLNHFPYVFAFPFPGGATIGVLMMVNLLAAHTLRFRSQARGMRLVAGLAALTAGVFFTYVVIALGDFHQGLREKPLLSWEGTALLTLFGAITSSCVLGAAAIVFGSRAASTGDKQGWVRTALSATGAVVSALGCVLLAAFFNDVSALRILWQLIQGTMAGVVLLGGCWLVFDKRAGIVLLHCGIGLMMLSQLFVGLWAVEERISIEEGETSAFAFDTRVSELAVVESTESSERHVVIPQKLLEQAAEEPGRVLSHDDLPFDLQVVQFYKNSSLAGPKEGKGENLATAGAGLEVLAVERPVGAGASSDAGVDMPSVYVKLTEKTSGKEIGTYLASTRLNEDHVVRGDSNYQLGLRFKREYKPYSMTLKDAKRENYPGSTKPRSYESLVQFVDARHNVDRPVKISMNNPFRYLGETFYQSGMDTNPGNGKEYSVFQVVTNAGWMTPYVACMIVAVGLIYQFELTLMKFILSEPREALRGAMLVASTAAFGLTGTHVIASMAPPIETPPQPKRMKRKPEAMEPAAAESWASWFRPSWFAVGTIAFSLLLLGYGFMKAKPQKHGFNLYDFGRLPVVDQGRTKPLDSLAQETLLGLSNKTTASDADGKSYSAVEWLLLTITKPEQAEQLHVIRIEHPEVIGALQLPADRKTMRFSLAELRTKEAADELQKQLKQIDDKKPEDYTPFENKLAELGRRLQGHMRVKEAFIPETLDLPSRSELNSKDPKATQKAMEAVQLLESFGSHVERQNPPLAVPVSSDALEAIARGRKWVPFSVSSMFGQFMEIMPAERAAELDKSTAELRSIFTAFSKDEPGAFNFHVASYQAWLERREPAMYNASKLSAETYLNHYGPFGWMAGLPLYLLAFVISAVGLVVFRREMGSAAFWMLVIVFVMHTIALGTRIYISGRPPVTNLYSSAVFIGWAAVFMGLVLEGTFRIGVGNLIAAMAGMGSLLVAQSLSLTERDTIGVMEAVLDTQFWLATHVVSITLGYASTYVAGLLGIAYIFRGLFTSNLDAREGKLLARMIYGVVCFAMLFSFVGTVLGGLWADDSWGRFWGWDPKENGALIIVLWNAFILHAKWDKLANERGLAVLAVVGNIVTSWSWFGTNLLGVGLHSYGFSQAIGLALVITVLVNLLIIGLGLLPKSLWWSLRERQSEQALPA